MTLARVPTGDLAHSGKACFAACTASLNSASVDNGTLEITSCVACTIESDVTAFLEWLVWMYQLIHRRTEHGFSRVMK